MSNRNKEIENLIKRAEIHLQEIKKIFNAFFAEIETNKDKDKKDK